MTAVEQQTIAGTEQRKLKSVTTILSDAIQAGRGLVNWHCEQTAMICIDRRATLETMGREEAIRWAVNKRYEATERAMKRGTEVHKMAESIALGTPTPLLEPEVKAEIQPYVDQLVRWFETFEPSFVMAEAPIYNLTHGYAGTCDGVFDLPQKGIFPGGRFIFDYKTTPKGPDAKSRHPYSEVALQLSAYRHAELVGLEPPKKEERYSRRWYFYDAATPTRPMIEVDKALCVVVSPFDCMAVPVSVGPIPWQAFLHAKEVGEWNTEDWKPAFGAPLTTGVA